jgi:type II secretory pathway pseudopilin PulG
MTQFPRPLFWAVRANARSRSSSFSLSLAIIAVLIAILLPALNRAREAAKQVQCLSNMKQLSNAVIMFANENRGWMPGRAGTGTPVCSTSPSGSWNTRGMDGRGDPRKRVLGVDRVSTTNRSDLRLHANKPDANQNITLGALAKYLGYKPVFQPVGPGAETKSRRRWKSLFRCRRTRLAAERRSTRLPKVPIDTATA